MDAESITVSLGHAVGKGGAMNISVIVHRNGSGHVELKCFPINGRKKTEVILKLDRAGYDHLKAVLESTDGSLGQLVETGQLKRFVVE